MTRQLPLTAIEWNPPELASQSMQAPPGGPEVAGLRRRIQDRQLQPQLGRMLRLDSGLGAFPEKRFEPFVSEALDRTVS